MKDKDNGVRFGGCSFGAGVAVAIIAAAAMLILWFSVESQTKGIIIGVGLGIIGVLAGAAGALAFVAVMLLRALNWSIQGGQQPPIIMQQPALPAPQPQYERPPHGWRPQRDFRVLGGQQNNQGGSTQDQQQNSTVEGEFRSMS